MKKFLSLVLALVMTMSLVTISAGAKDFTDAASIDYKEAVAVMSDLKIVDGTTDGAFNPDGALTRGAAAKIICNLVLGPTTAAALKADAAPFVDVPANHTFAAYIAYCVQHGILDGYNDGTFRPSNPLTGYAFMKMLLGALGYDKDVEGFNGPNWSVNVAKLAISIGLDDGNDNFNGVATVTRQEALQYAFNTMKATMVEYGTTTTLNVNGASVIIGGSKAKAVEDINPTKNDYRENSADQDKYVQFCEKYFPKLELDKDVTTDAFKRPANVWYNGKTKIGSFSKAADLTYTADQKAKTIYADLDLNDAYTFTVVVDGAAATSVEIVKRDGEIAGAVAGDKIAVAGGRNAGLVGNGSLIEVYKDEKLIVVTNTYLMQAAADYNSKKETLTLADVADTKSAAAKLAAGENVLSIDDFAIANYEADDYVLVTIAGGKIRSIKPAEMVTATATDYVHAESLTASGETYNYAWANDNTGFAYALKTDYKLYVDNYGYVILAKGVENANYVYIDEFAASSQLTANSKVVAYAYFMDGTEDEIVVSKVGGEKVNGTDVAALTAIDGKWFTYTNKNDKYELTVATKQNSVATYTAGDEITNYDEHGVDIDLGDQGVIKGNKTTKFIVLKKNGDVKVFEGIKNVADITAAADTTIAVIGNNAGMSYAKYVFIDLNNGTMKGGSNTSDIVFIMGFDKAGNDADDDEYYRYKAIRNGVEEKVLVDQAWAGNVADDFLYSDLEVNAKGYIVDMNKIDGGDDDDTDVFEYYTAVNGAASFKDNTLTIGAKGFYMADSYQIFMINADKNTVDTYTSARSFIAHNGTVAAGTKITAVIGDDAYTALYIVK